MRRLLIAAAFLLLAGPARAIQTYLPSAFAKTSTVAEFLPLDTSFAVTDNNQTFFVLSTLTVYNSTSPPVTVTLTLHENAGAVPDVTTPILIPTIGTYVIQLPISYTGGTLGIGPHTFRVKVAQNTTQAVVYQIASYLGVFNNSIGGGVGGILSLNTLTGAVQTLAVDFTGTTPAWSSVANTHTLLLPDAGPLVLHGLISNAAQTIEGVKTFQDPLDSYGTAGLGSFAAGQSADALLAGGVAIGPNALVAGQNGVAIGSGAGCGEDSICIGRFALTNDSHKLVVGSVLSPIDVAYFGSGVDADPPGSIIISGTGGQDTDGIAAPVIIRGGMPTGCAQSSPVSIRVTDTTNCATNDDPNTDHVDAVFEENGLGGIVLRASPNATSDIGTSSAKWQRGFFSKGVVVGSDTQTVDGTLMYDGAGKIRVAGAYFDFTSPASSTVPGHVTLGAQQFKGTKTFLSKILFKLTDSAGGDAHFVQGTRYVSVVTSSIASSTAETTMRTVSIAREPPAGTLYHIRGGGSAETSGSDTVTLRWKLAGVEICATGALDLAGVENYRYELDVVVRTAGTTASVVCSGILTISTVPIILNNTTVVDLDGGPAISFTFTSQHSASSVNDQTDDESFIFQTEGECNGACG